MVGVSDSTVGGEGFRGAQKPELAVVSGNHSMRSLWVCLWVKTLSSVMSMCVLLMLEAVK